MPCSHFRRRRTLEKVSGPPFRLPFRAQRPRFSRSPAGSQNSENVKNPNETARFCPFN
jgi:hypothetical protein